MTVQRFTASEFATQLSNGVNSRDRSIDTRIGPIRDIFIDPISEVLENQNDRVVYLNRLLSLKYADKLVPDDVDDIIFNENIVRWGSTSGVTTVTFSRATAPSADITIPINFPLSTPVSPSTGSSIIFRTIETKTMYAASSGQYYNANTGRFEIQVSVKSTAQGSSTTVGAYTITQFRRPFPEFDTVFNETPTTDGKSIETNAEVALRYSLHVSGSQIGTPSGLKSFLLDNISSVDDVYIVYGENSYLTRDQYDAGAVDAWVLGDLSATRSYTTYYNGTYTLNKVDFQPIMSVDSVSSVAAASTYLEGDDFEVETGVGEYSYSNQASDGIRWLPGGSHPDVGDDITITYKYNSLMNILQSFFNQPAFYHMSSDNLFRWAQPTQLEINADLKISSGSPEVVKASVRNAVLTYINNLKLGQDVEEFDIDSEVSKISGVDNWVYNQLSVFGGSGVSDITIGPNTYARLSGSDFVINMV